MTPEQFCYWLQGIAEAGNTTVQPTPQQWTIIKDHLATVFNKVTPKYTPPQSNDPIEWPKVVEPFKWVEWTHKPITLGPLITC